MADGAAVYGLIGAVGGALLGALGTLSVPLLQNRRTDRERDRSRAEGHFEKLMALRNATRDLVMLLEDTLDQRSESFTGNQFNEDRFRSDIQAAKRKVIAAAEGLWIHGWDFRIHNSTPGPDYTSTLPNPYTGAAGQVVNGPPVADAFNNFAYKTFILSRMIESGVAELPFLDRRSRGAYDAFREVEESRKVLMGYVLERMGALRDGDLS
ncbi:hypothetical protein [Streptomyces sp. NPDC001536]|uniref:hypothetical protein n=1 Tax=Streptomyces sp. NPDC001536 TaxID=3364583 RepID=UPI0036AE9F57